MSLTDFTAAVSGLVRDESLVLSTDDISRAITQMLARINHDQPRTEVLDLSVEHGYAPLPDNWVVNVSQVVSCEYPLGQRPRRYIDAVLYTTPSEVTLDVQAATDGPIRLTYSLPHLLDDDADTLPDQYREACACYSAAILCDQLAGYYSQTESSTIQSDAVDHNDKGRQFASRANGLRKRYREIVPTKTAQTSSPSAIAQWDGASVNMFHRRRSLR